MRPYARPAGDSAEDMVKKIAVAVEARASADFLIIARTDARSALGLDEAIRRARPMPKAGADILFVESPETEDEMAEIGRELGDPPLVANMVEGGRTPVLSNARPRRSRLRDRHLPGRRPAQRRGGARRRLPADPRDWLLTRLSRAAIPIRRDEPADGL